MRAGHIAVCRTIAAGAAIAALAPGTAGAAYNPALAVSPGETAHMVWNQTDARNVMVQERR